MTTNSDARHSHDTFQVSSILGRLCSLAGWRVLLLAIALCVMSQSVWAQPPTTDGERRSQLGEQQRLVERKMTELENKFTAIALQIQEKEPDRAKKLIEAYQQAREQLLTQRMAEVASLLDSNQLTAAQTKLDEVIAALDELVKLLINQNDQGLSKDREIEMLQQWKQSIQQMQQDQKQQRQETEKVANKDDTLNKLDAQIKKLDELIKKQQDVISQTEENGGKGLQALDRIADLQFDIRKQTDKLKEEIAGDPANPSDPKNPDPADKTDAAKGDPSSKPSDKPTEKSDAKQGNPADSKPSEPSAGKSGDSKSGPPSQPKDGQPGEGQPKPGGEPSDSKSPSTEPPKPGQKPLEQASQSQQRAEEKLASGKAADAQRQQEKAVDDLKQARNELEKEKRRIASLPPEAFQQMAQAQRRTRDKAMELAKKMAEAPKPKPSSEDQAQAGDQNKKQPGQQQVQDAGDSMQKAAKDLNEQDAQQAERKQREAEKKLQQALDEIEERLNQLREETREEKLKRLEARFREMLDRQKIASVMTVELNDKQTNLGAFKRRDQLLLLRMSTEESEISELGQQAYDLLLEDGTSVVFPEIVQDLRGDLDRASQLLAQERTDQLTQLIQREIEATLQELLDSLKEAKKEGGGGGGGGGGGKQPLLKKSAELKMLRASQLRVNRQTKQFDAIQSGRGLDGDLETEIKNIAERQAQLLEMAERIMDNDSEDK